MAREVAVAAVCPQVVVAEPVDDHEDDVLRGTDFRRRKCNQGRMARRRAARLHKGGDEIYETAA